jgi:hydrogenase nickel incorporation protein HypA/HybF
MDGRGEAMHEVSVMQSALEIALEQTRANGGSRIHKMTLRIGAFSGVVASALRFAFDVVTEGTPAEGAELVIEDVPLSCVCDTCGLTFQPPSYSLACPDGPDHRTRILSGQELDVAALEIS